MIAILPETLQWALLWAVLVVSVGASSLFSSMETALYVINKIRLDLHAESGSRSAKLLRKLLVNPNNMLVVLLVGNNLVNYTAAFVVSTMLVLAGVHKAELYTLALLTPTMFILCESVPKNVSERLGERLMYPLAGFLKWCSWLFNISGVAPAVRGVTWGFTRLPGLRAKRSPLGHEGFSAIVAEGRASGVLTHFQSIMADRIMHIQEVRLSDVMIPMSKVARAWLDVSHQDMLERFRNHEFSRMPLLDASGQVVGVVDSYDILGGDAQVPPSQKMIAPLQLEASLQVTDALYQMQRSRRMMAVVHNRAGKHVGIVTIKDIVEEIVGELEAW